jgi:hypothetical protein
MVYHDPESVCVFLFNLLALESLLDSVALCITESDDSCMPLSSSCIRTGRRSEIELSRLIARRSH